MHTLTYTVDGFTMTEEITEEYVLLFRIRELQEWQINYEYNFIS